MSYDCTLHIIDPTRIRQVFVPKLLGDSSELTPFDEIHPDAAQLWERARDSLQNQDPATAANEVCLLALAFCAAELPYHTERGFSLSWFPFDKNLRTVVFPRKFCSNPEVLFKRVVERHRKLRRKFSSRICESWKSGVYLAKGAVPEALKWLRSKMSSYLPGERQRFRGLELILERCTEMGLAYWEASEVQVPLRTVEGRTPPGYSPTMKVDFPLNRPNSLAHNLCHARGALVMSGDDCTLVSDLSRWPARVGVLEERALSVACSVAGRWAFVSSPPGHCAYRVRLRETPIAEDWTDLWRAEWAGFLGEQLVVVVEQEHPSPSVVRVQDGDKLVEIKGLKPRPDRGEWRGPDTKATVTLGDGGQVFIWLDSGYELIDGRFACTFPAHFFRGPRETIPTGGDGFYFLMQGEYGSSLHEVHRGDSKPVQHLWRYRVRSIAPGPEGALLVKHDGCQAGDGTPQDDIGMVYFPQTDEMIRITAEVVPEEGPGQIHWLHWAQGPDLLVAATCHCLWAVPMEQVLSFPRIAARCRN